MDRPYPPRRDVLRLDRREQFRGLQRFADEVGPLLPEEERALLDRWCTTTRRCWRATGQGAHTVELSSPDGQDGLVARFPSDERPQQDDSLVGEMLTGLAVSTG